MEGLDRLDARCRRMIRALYLEDPPASYAEIAGEFCMPLGSVGPTRARCLEKLRKTLEHVFKPEGGSTNE
jgi:DNA-directed RNA polymerase specialized sigma24 family protein